MTTKKQFLEVKEWFRCNIFTQMYFTHMTPTFQAHQLFHHTNWEVHPLLHSWVADFLTTLQPHYSKGQHTPSNLTPPQCAVLNTLLNHHCFIVFLADKNLGLSIIKSDKYIRWVPTKHLSDMNTYHCLPFHEACNILESTHSLFTEFIVDYCQLFPHLIVDIWNAIIPLMILLYTFISLQKFTNPHGAPAPSFHAVDCSVMALVNGLSSNCN